MFLCILYCLFDVCNWLSNIFETKTKTNGVVHNGEVHDSAVHKRISFQLLVAIAPPVSTTSPTVDKVGVCGRQARLPQSPGCTPPAPQVVRAQIQRAVEQSLQPPEELSLLCLILHLRRGSQMLVERFQRSQ